MPRWREWQEAWFRLSLVTLLFLGSLQSLSQILLKHLPLCLEHKWYPICYCSTTIGSWPSVQTTSPVSACFMTFTFGLVAAEKVNSSPETSVAGSRAPIEVSLPGYSGVSISDNTDWLDKSLSSSRKFSISIISTSPFSFVGMAGADGYGGAWLACLDCLLRRFLSEVALKASPRL